MNLHCLRTGPFSVNTYFIPVSENEVVVIDPAACPYSGDEDSVLDYLNSKNLIPVAVVLTHGHFDHVSGLPVLKKSFPKLPVAIHGLDSHLIGHNSQISQGKALWQMGFEEFLPFVSDLSEADFLLEEKKSLAQIFSSLELSDEAKNSLTEWSIIHTPGHTEGSCCLYNELEKTLISGDTLFYRSWGRTDLDGGNESKIHESLFKIKDLCDEKSKVYPGHDYFGFTLSENF